MKLKTPAIYSYAELGSRGAWTGNALLPTLLLVTLHTALNNNQTALKARSNHKLSASTVTCLEGDRPNAERIQATGRHVTGLPQPQTLDDYKRASQASFCYNKKKAWNRGIRREPQRLDRIHRQ
ncbi:hypothetical protein HP570_15345 [Brevibacillus sp. RS1.1]|uniref:hypothetical protein n=1 Tax=Brevibacillus sp. RS1.1 TaxID=2738982 RepID=UPI00156A86FA|nr:hypothetical protein [Brevibacillus sp. RS1.1]NRR03594.1 hypothetical protein [Brevibacillus sp. RS1.1]